MAGVLLSFRGTERLMEELRRKVLAKGVPRVLTDCHSPRSEHREMARVSYLQRYSLRSVASLVPLYDDVPLSLPLSLSLNARGQDSSRNREERQVA